MGAAAEPATAKADCLSDWFAMEAGGGSPLRAIFLILHPCEKDR